MYWMVGCPPGGSAGTSFCRGTEISINLRAMAFPRWMFFLADVVTNGRAAQPGSTVDPGQCRKHTAVRYWLHMRPDSYTSGVIRRISPFSPMTAPSAQAARRGILVRSVILLRRRLFCHRRRPNVRSQSVANAPKPAGAALHHPRKLAARKSDRAPQRRQTEGDEHLVMPHALAALDEPEIADDAIRPAAHAGELRTLEMTAHTRQHTCSMHRTSIPSILTAAESTSPRRKAVKALRCCRARRCDAPDPLEPARGSTPPGDRSAARSMARAARSIQESGYGFPPRPDLRPGACDSRAGLFPVASRHPFGHLRGMTNKNITRTILQAANLQLPLKADAENLQSAGLGRARFGLRSVCL